MKITKTRHYVERHERNFPFEDVKRIINTAKGRPLGRNLVKYEIRTKRQVIYVLCSIDRKNNELKVINAKRIDKRLL